MSSISTLVSWQALMSHTYLKVPQCTALLQSLLEIEVVWKLSIVRDSSGSKSVPMLQEMLSNGYRYVTWFVIGWLLSFMHHL